MNLYLISQSINNGYDTYSDAVVACDNENEARLIHPGNGGTWQDNPEYPDSSDESKAWIDNNGDREFGWSWCEPEFVKVELIGIANTNIKRDVICASFYAG